jgi:uncharacterized protein
MRRLPRLERTKCMHECVRAKLKLLGLARSGNVEAQFQLGVFPRAMFANESIRWLQRAAQKRHAKAFESLSLRASGHSYRFDDRARFRRLLRAGKLGNADAQCGVGALYATGDPVAKDLQAAIVWYRRAARQENAEAQYNLGMMYLDGEGCAVNTARGLDWTKRAIRNGYDYAASALADMYEDGVWGVECDPKKAAYWRRLYEKSSRRT